MKLQDYISSKGYVRISGAIEDRWRGRIVHYGWDKQGEDGAAKYLVRFGKSIGVPKVLALAACAKYHGCPDVANGFYKYAARMEGVAIDKPMSGAFDQLAHRMVKMKPVVSTQPNANTIEIEFPAMFQPGKVDFKKLPGAVLEEVLAFVTTHSTRYQLAGQDGLLESLEFRVDERLCELAKVFGTLVLHCELAWVDFAAVEHPTVEALVQANEALGFDTLLPEPILTIKQCLYGRTPSGNNMADIAFVLQGEFVRARQN